MMTMHMNRSLTSGKCKLKPRDILNPLKLLKLKILTPLNSSEQMKLFYLAGWQCKMVQSVGEIDSWGNSCQVKRALNIQPSSSIQ